MNKTMKRNVLLSAVLAIMLCVSLIAGATFALFTSESKVNIAVTSGKVQVEAHIQNLELYSPTSIALNGSIVDPANKATGETFANGGSASVSENELTLSGVTPGDKVTFEIHVENKSNVAIKYRTILACTEDDGLFSGLKVEIGNEINTYAGNTVISEYKGLSAGEEIMDKETIVPVSIELPTTAGNEYQDKSTTISYKVEAVQGNTETSDPDASTTYIYSAHDLVALQSKTGVSRIEFLNDIDMAGYAWNGLTTSNFVDERGGVVSTIVGNGHTISHLSKPLVAYTAYEVAISNLTIAESTIATIITSTNEDASGAFVATADYCDITLTDCKVESTVIGDNQAKYAGAFVGYFSGNALTISGCEATSSTSVKGYKNLGGIIGFCQTSTYEQKIENCTSNAILANAEHVGTVVGTVNNPYTLTINGTYAEKVCGRIVDATVIINDTVYCSAAYLKNVLSANNYNVTLAHDYVVVDAWTPVSFNVPASFTLDGAGHTISGLTNALVIGQTNMNVQISNLTIASANILANTQATTNGLATAAFVASVDAGSQVILNNCHVVSSKIEAKNFGSAEPRAAAFLGYISDGTASLVGCTVTDTEIVSESGAAGLIGATYANTTIENCSVNGNSSVKSTENRTGKNAIAGYLVGSIIDSKAHVAIKGCTVASTVSIFNDGAQALANGLVGRTVLGGTFEIDGTAYVTAAQLQAILSGANVTLTKNYVLTDAWTSLRNTNSYNAVVLDGAGHYIAGLTTALYVDTYTSSLTVKNLTIKDSTIAYIEGNCQTGIGAIVGYMTGEDVTIVNCHLQNVTVNNDGSNLQVGGFIGSFNTAKLTVSGCTVTDCEINADSSAGAIVGLINSSNGEEIEISDCTVTGCSIKSFDSGNWRIGAIVGTVCGDGETKITNCTQSNNTFAMVNSSATNPGHELYGRIVSDKGATVVIA